MGVEELPSSGNKFTGSRMIVPGVGLNTYRVQKNDKFSIRRNPFANSINASPTPTPSVTPTNTPTPSVTPTQTPTPSSSPLPSPQTFIFSGSSLDEINISLSFDSVSFYAGGVINWGDGNTSNISSSSVTSYSNNYGSLYTGNITITYYGDIKSIECSSGTLPAVSTSVVFNTTEISNLTELQTLRLTSNATRLIGQMSNISALNNLTTLTIRNDYTTLSNLSYIPISVTNFSIGSSGYSIITGDILSLSGNNLTSLTIAGTNTVYGDISTLPSTLSTMIIQGNNTLSGNTSDFNFPSLLSLTLTGNNTIDGDVVNLPPNVTSITILGDNTLYGNLSDFPPSIRSINLGSQPGGLITGDLSDLPNASYNTLQMTSDNYSISANTATIPLMTGATFNVKIDGSLSGDLSDIFNGGADFPICSFILNGLNASPCSLTYTSGVFPWGSLSATIITIYTSTNLTNTEIDNLLIDLDSYGGGVTWVSCAGGANQLQLKGARTSASNAALASLIGKGVTVTITP